MPSIYAEKNTQQARHTDDMQDIITAVPGWLLSWGTSMFFGILLLIGVLGALIKYPDIVNAQLKIDSPNSPKPVVSKIAGKLVTLLVKENEEVKANQPLAYLESTANHAKVLLMLNNLKQLQQQVLQNKPIDNVLFNQQDNIQLGELQSAYQTFFQEYLAYKSSVNNGFLVKKKGYLQQDLQSLTKQQEQLKAQKLLEQKDLKIAVDEYEMHKKLAEQRVETKREFTDAESKYLGKQSSIVQTESAIITGENNYAAKQKDILELENQVQEEKSKFLQAINSLVSGAEDWQAKYVLSASQAGRLQYAGVIQENQVLTPGQDVFYINPGNEAFFGTMTITQNNMGKVREGQQVLIKLKSYPFEEYGMIRGKIKYISDVPYKDSVYVSKVDFKIRNTSDLKKPIRLKQGMLADAEIITQDATILQRLTRSFFKIMGTK
ncbi:HlyD family efflux transporter periplasmic adaptor subunit [Mucilaginibacter xinganensis]|uniref:Secretion protein HlyD n=1 Tax=Mucilaginibacter xinganensis TaxID=1234841 RepID=A0A223NT01_9SPHI|nr:HlyD family efflux transporter periplasmic adaptor subunit [Mucilaginibacter xinganensis]ASU32977.1 secretion protein HlyD [Mucilaginibacter xinganensis]